MDPSVAETKKGASRLFKHVGRPLRVPTAFLTGPLILIRTQKQHLSSGSFAFHVILYKDASVPSGYAQIFRARSAGALSGVSLGSQRLQTSSDFLDTALGSDSCVRCQEPPSERPQTPPTLGPPAITCSIRCV